MSNASNVAFHTGVQHHSLEKLRADLWNWERIPCHDEGARRERDDRVANIKRDIALIESGRFKVGHP
jgi:hypothetical protein